MNLATGIYLFSGSLFFISPQLSAQGKPKDSVACLSRYKALSVAPELFSVKTYIIPGTLIGYGFAALGSRPLKSFDEHLKTIIWDDNPHHTVKIDNYLQFAPAFSVYVLNMSGIRGEHNLIDRTAVYVLSNLLLNVSVSSLKDISHKQRPDGSDHLSFPSGHTAEAFVSAEFMRLEYRHVSVWYGVAGYLIAGAVGYLRMYNNKHYFSEVVTGAGLGIASTDLSYWLYPKIRRLFCRQRKAGNLISH